MTRSYSAGKLHKTFVALVEVIQVDNNRVCCGLFDSEKMRSDKIWDQLIARNYSGSIYARIAFKS